MTHAVDHPASAAQRVRRCILGTAGHIDHGKSALVLTLTGIDPDRLPEERTRGMTIELGFAHCRLDLQDGAALQLAIVDVPGHERFVRTMVAGATGIDLGLLVVAADDGVMPQTREHVEILDLLGIETGLIAITKTDLAHEQRIAEVRTQIETLVAQSALASWPIVATSAKSGQGLDALRAAIVAAANSLTVESARPVFRMAIDRVFTVHGRGTVVTGSVLSGRAEAGQDLELHPAGVACRVREVQSHGSAVTDVAEGQRAALNLTGLDKHEVARSMELATPGYLSPSRHVDARVNMLARLDKPFPSHRRVRVCIGTTEAIAVLVVVGGDAIQPADSAMVQLRFQRPVVAEFGQRFILRRETADATIGGGEVIRPVSRRIAPHRPEEIDALRRATATDVYDRYEETVRRAGFELRAAGRIACEIGAEPADIPSLAERLRKSGRLVELRGHTVHADVADALSKRAIAYLKRHHANRPQEPGVQRDRFIGWIDRRSAAGVGKDLVQQLEDDRKIESRGPYIADASFRPALSPEDARLLEAVVREIEAGKFDPPAWDKLKATAGLSKQRQKVLDDLVKCQPRLVKIAPDQFLSAQAVGELKTTVDRLAAKGPFKLADVRDTLGLSRRVVQPMLEYLDRIQYTRRVGDERVRVEGRS